MTADIHQCSPLVVEFHLDALRTLGDFRNRRCSIVINLLTSDQSHAIDHHEAITIIVGRLDCNSISPPYRLADVGEADLRQFLEDSVLRDLRALFASLHTFLDCRADLSIT